MPPRPPSDSTVTCNWIQLGTFLDQKIERRAKAPAGCPYRLIISFQTEEQRVKWVASDAHQKAWATVENTLIGPKFEGER